MTKDWQDLIKIVNDEEITVERVQMRKSNIVIEGSFDLPPLAKLSTDDQIFAAAFLKCHGSIKQMEKMFGVSYPTIKNRLNRITADFDFLDIEAAPAKSDVLEQLDKGEISVDEALKKLRK